MYAKPTDDIILKSRGMRSICDDAGIPLAAAAIQFTLAHPNVAAVIPGAKLRQEPLENHAYMNTTVPAEVWQRMKSEGLLEENAPTPE